MESTWILKDVQKALDSALTEPDWLVPNFVQRGQVVLIAAEGGGGKTFLLMELADALAKGRKVLETFEPCPYGPQTTLYIDFEMYERSFFTRFRLFEPGQGVRNLRYCDECTDRNDEKSFHAMVEKSGAQVVMLDALVRFVPEENDNSQVARWNLAYLSPLKKSGITTFVAHHMNKNELAEGSHRVRGASEIFNFADHVFTLEHQYSQREPTLMFKAELKHTKARDGFVQEDMVLVAETKDGKAVLSLIGSQAIEETVLALLRGTVAMKRTDLVSAMQLPQYGGPRKLSAARRAVTRAMQSLIAQKLALRIGKGQGVKYAVRDTLKGI